MKKTILSLGILILSVGVSAQSFVEDGRLWNVKVEMNFAGSWTESFKFEGDTMIGQYAYNKYFRTLDTTYSSWSLNGAMREMNDSVFMIDFDYEGEMLLYDFNLSVGDVFTTNIMGCDVYYLVDEIDTVVLMNGEQRERILFDWSTYWIKGIGSSFGPSQVGYDWCMIDMYYDLTCSFLDGEQMYQNPFYNCFVYTLDIDEIKIENNYIVYPNPFTTSTTIEYQLDQPETIIITFYNHLGKQVDLIQQYQQQGKQFLHWNPQGLPSGMYFFTLQAGDQVAIGKVVLMR